MFNQHHALIFSKKKGETIIGDTNWCVDEVINSIEVVSVTMGQSHLRGTKSFQMRSRNWVNIIGF